jgi:hypothetical protein
VPFLSLPTTTDECTSASLGEYGVNRLFRLAKKLAFHSEGEDVERRRSVDAGDGEPEAE